MGRPADVYGATELAQLIGCDPKTVHNYVNSGRLKGYRTPGRHIRVHRAELVAFLEKYGYPPLPGSESCGNVSGHANSPEPAEGHNPALDGRR